MFHVKHPLQYALSFTPSRLPLSTEYDQRTVYAQRTTYHDESLGGPPWRQSVDNR